MKTTEKPIITLLNGELKIVYPSGKTMYFKQEETVMNDREYYFITKDNAENRNNGEITLHL